MEKRSKADDIKDSLGGIALLVFILLIVKGFIGLPWLWVLSPIWGVAIVCVATGVYAVIKEIVKDLFTGE